jgi:hypothetical protein
VVKELNVLWEILRLVSNVEVIDIVHDFGLTALRTILGEELDGNEQLPSEGRYVDSSLGETEVVEVGEFWKVAVVYSNVTGYNSLGINERADHIDQVQLRRLVLLN